MSLSQSIFIVRSLFRSTYFITSFYLRKGIRKFGHRFDTFNNSKNYLHSLSCNPYKIALSNNIIIFLGQMFLLDRFFEGAFFTFGLEVIAFAERDQEDRLDPLIYIFPRMTKCTFHKFGVSGEVEKHDALCILPLNIVNEKIYIFLWFWFIILGGLSALVIVYRFVIVVSPKMRAYLLYIRFRLIKREVINTIVKKSKMGDWFLFYMLGQNVDSIIFKEVMHELARRLGHQSKDFET